MKPVHLRLARVSPRSRVQLLRYLRLASNVHRPGMDDSDHALESYPWHTLDEETRKAIVERVRASGVSIFTVAHVASLLSVPNPRCQTHESARTPHHFQSIAADRETLERVAASIPIDTQSLRDAACAALLLAGLTPVELTRLRASDVHSNGSTVWVIVEGERHTVRTEHRITVARWLVRLERDGWVCAQLAPDGTVRKHPLAESQHRAQDRLAALRALVSSWR